MSEPEKSHKSLEPLVAINMNYREESAYPSEEVLDADAAERLMEALSDPLDWHEFPARTRTRASGRKHGTSLYDISAGSLDANRNPIYFSVQHREGNGDNPQQLLAANTDKVRLFTTMDEAKAACDRHFATGKWPE